MRVMIVESLDLGSGLSDGQRVLVARGRVLAEHGVARVQDARQFDEFVLRIGGSLRQLQGSGGGIVWDLPRAALDRSREPSRRAHLTAAHADATRR